MRLHAAPHALPKGAILPSMQSTMRKIMQAADSTVKTGRGCPPLSLCSPTLPLTRATDASAPRLPSPIHIFLPSPQGQNPGLCAHDYLWDSLRSFLSQNTGNSIPLSKWPVRHFLSASLRGGVGVGGSRCLSPLTGLGARVTSYPFTKLPTEPLGMLRTLA